MQQQCDESCKDCRFFKIHIYQFDETSIESDYGSCHRYPPEVTMDTDQNGFPMVQKDNWCGEFQQK